MNSREPMKNFLIIAIFSLSTSVMAQTIYDASGKYTDHFPQLPPLCVDTRISLSSLHQGSQVKLPESHKAASNETPQSIMLHSSKAASMPQFKIKATIYNDKKTGEALKELRDVIYRKRMEKQGRPVQPRVAPNGRIVR